MSKHMYLALSLGLIVSNLSAEVLSFIEKDYNNFVERMVPLAQRKAFNSYFKEVEKRILSKNESEQARLRSGFYETALTKLKAEHQIWADSIQTFLTDIKYLDKKYDKERDGVRQFLYWCGTFDGFQVATKTKRVPAAPMKKGFIDNMKDQATKVAHKVGDWYKKLKTRLT